VVLNDRIAPQGSHSGVTSETVVQVLNEKVNEVRGALMDSWGSPPGLLSASEIENLLAMHSDWSSWISELPLCSMRSKHKVIRVALSLSAWDGKRLPSKGHFIESYSYRWERLSLNEPS
jgi:hypothetical protein